MSRVLTTDNLVKTLKRRAMLPTDQVTFSKQDFIEILNEEFDVGVLTHLLSTHEEYLVHEQDESISSSNQQRFRIPYRAIGNKLRGLSFISSANDIYPLTRIEIDDLHFYTDNFSVSYSSYAFYVEHDEVVLVDVFPSNYAAIRYYYYLRPSKLVEDKYGAVITGIDRTTGVVSVDKIPSNFNVSQQFDFTQSRTPNKLYKFDVDSSNINSSSKTMTFSPDDIPSELIVGDYITVAEESIVPQIPTELHPLLAQRAAVHCLEAIGDTNGLQLAQRKLEEMEKSLANLIDNRVESAVQKVNNLNSPLKTSSRVSRRRD